MIFNTIFLKNLDWWKTELIENPQNHIGPACITAAATLLVAALWDKYQALGFACLTIASYPITHHQIKYLMCVDLHETIYAAAIVGIQLFCRQFPNFSQCALPMSLALAYAFTVRGMTLRHSLEEQRAEIQTLNSLNIQLKQKVDQVSEKLEQLKTELETYITLVQKQQQLSNEGQEIQNKNTIIVGDLKTRFALLANECQQFKVAKPLVQSDDQKQIAEKLDTFRDELNQLKQKFSQEQTETILFSGDELLYEQQIQNSLKEIRQELLSSIA